MFSKTKPLGFRKWLELENLKSKSIEATEKSEFPDRIYAYLSVALDIPVNKLEKKDWESTVLSLTKAVSSYPLNKIPLLAPHKEKKEKGNEDWDYEGRTWFYYAHLLSNAYGWTLEYIANLDPNEALAHLQEILTREQLDREFLYGLSEVAYHYNKTTKQSDFKPMPRPHWMRASSKPIKKTRMRRSLLPIGAGVDMTGLPDEYGIKNIINTGH